MKIRALIVLLGISCTLPWNAAAAQTVRVVNMIPATLATETWQDSEPDVTVNPNDPLQIVGSAFTINPTGSLTTAPIYCSSDGGNTWVLSNIVPSANGWTGDITVALSRNNVLYAGILHGGSGLDMRLLRSGTCATAASMTQLVARTNEDQPYARAYTPMAGAQLNNDHVYIAHNDFNASPTTASIEQSLNAATAAPPAGLAPLVVERRTPNPQDGPPVRQAIHPGGTIYGAYTEWASWDGVGLGTGRIVVVRDDDWGQGTPFYDNLVGADMLPGQVVAGPVDWVWANSPVFGQERLSPRLTIAVDPTDDRVVYVSWADRPSGVVGNTATLHVRRSPDGGATWSADLLTIPGALNPQLAVNIRGDVGFLYQQLTGPAGSERWGTHFRQSTNGGGVWSDIVLADVPANTPAVTFVPYLGDYAGLTAVGKDFYGIFSAANTPNSANFPSGVTYQRPHDFTTQTLGNGIGGTVAASIDPFFFHIGNLAAEHDFYVRDWTLTAASHDTGLEPSTYPWFFSHPDVWNRRSNAPGAFNASDQPANETPHDVSLGNNFAFARVHRNAGGTAETVSVHFLYSEFGTGSNYVNAGATPDPTLSFAAADQALTMVAGYQWTLPVTSSTHLCLAVEIATGLDPVVQPSLLGRAPGWPTTDLSVIYDNNKGQRNMGVFPAVSIAGGIKYWAVVHNAATHRRDMVLEVRPDPTFTRVAGRPRVEVAGDGRTRAEEGRLVLLDMAPGESRWVALHVPALPQLREGELPLVTFAELQGTLPVNGFAIGVQRVPLQRAGVEGLRLLASNLRRMGAVLGVPEAAALAEELGRAIPRDEMDPRAYAELAGRFAERYRPWVQAAVRQAQGDRFGVMAALDTLGVVLRQGDPEAVYGRQASLDHAVDALLTEVYKQRGDPADVAQNMRWQADLLRDVPALGRTQDAAELREVSVSFDRGYAQGQLSARDYPGAVRRSLPALRRMDAALQLDQADALARMEASLNDPQALQRAHRDFLLRLDALRAPAGR
jgi:hypothetical protein